MISPAGCPEAGRAASRERASAVDDALAVPPRVNEPAAPARRARTSPIDWTLAILLAVIAAAWHGQLMTRATNDNFLHLALAQQWLRGDWPVRDFFDQGWVLQYALSAAAHLLFGERLGAESVIVAVAWAVSTVLVYQVVQRLTGSRVVSVACALLLVVSSARGYSYPKGIV